MAEHTIKPAPQASGSAVDAGHDATLAGARATHPVGVVAKLDQSAKDIAICLLVALAETLLVVIGMSGLLSLPTMLLVHCAIMLGVTLVLDQRERNRQDSRILAVAVVTTAVSGPLGAALSALLGVYLRYRKLETELLAKWYERISGHAQSDAVVELYERIQAGRTLNPYIDARARFAAILRSGPMEEKQRVLSIITQKYHPGFAGLLELALRNQDPPIRVQAAAVVARLKEQERGKAKSLSAQALALPPAAVRERLDFGRKIAALLESGLLDEQDAVAAGALVKSLAGDILAANPHDADAALLLADILMRAGDHAAATEYLQPLVARGVTEACQPLRDCLLRQRRFAAAAAIPASKAATTHDVAASGHAKRTTRASVSDLGDAA